MLLTNYRPSWERQTGDGDQLIELLVRPPALHCGLAQKEDSTAYQLPSARDRGALAKFSN